ncbi:MAG: helix-turn-helix domain-containing protein [Clostridiales bacterium]|nr:helix-turn-helix domain-containing protein [Clostridiales bacterium]
MVTLEEIRAKLVSAIRNSGMTQTTIAKKLGIYQSAVQQYLSGRAMPALDTLANLCTLLDLDANDILCIHEYAEPKKTVTVSNSFNNNTGKIDFKA